METAKFNFTKDAIGKLPTRQARYYVRDKKVQGLILDVLPSGVRTFRWYRKVNGSPQRKLIGRYPDNSTEQAAAIEHARGKASEYNAALARGDNPTAKNIADLTLGELFALYLERHAKPHKRSWKGDQWLFDRYLERWASRSLSSFDRSDVERLHTAIQSESGPYAANRVLSLISTLFNKADAWGWEGRNPARGVQKFKEQKRERFLHADELPRFFAALAGEPDADARDAILTMLLTGARKTNVLTMAWANVHLERALWTIPLTKAGESQRVALAPAAVQLLRERRTRASGEYVFPGRTGVGHRVEVSSAWKRIRSAAGIEDVRLHDLRRTLGSWQAAAGVSLPIIGKSLGHKDVATTQIYARLDLDPVRAAVTAATVAMLAAGDGATT